MFAGHLATALAAKHVEPRAPVGALVAAAFGIDLVWPVMLLAGLETVRPDPGNTAFTGLDFVSYPWTHSLVAVLAWSVAAGAVAMAVLQRRRAAWVIGLLVLSHWVLDAVTHRPDLPLWPGGPVVGLGLWHSIPGTIAVEGAAFAAAVVWYARTFAARDGWRRWAWWALVALVGVVWLSGPWSPPPPDARAVALVSLAMWMLPFWAQAVAVER